MPVYKLVCEVTETGKPSTGEAIHPGMVGITGVIILERAVNGVCMLKYAIKGLSPGLHGMHIHEAADFSQGDLGNIEADESGFAMGTISSSLVELEGEFSVLGRAIVIHAGADDLGKGGHELSLTTGNSGSRVACGEIKLAPEEGFITRKHIFLGFVVCCIPLIGLLVVIIYI